MYEREKLAELQDSLHQWEETTLKKASASLPERRETFITTSSEPINRLYTPLDVPNLDYHATSATLANIPTRAESMPRCTAPNCGQCACSLGSAPPRRPTPASNTCSNRARPVYRLPSTWPP